MKIHVTCVCACVHLGLTVSADDISLSRYFVETHKVMKTLFPIKGKFEICLPLFFVRLKNFKLASFHV